MSGGGGFVSVVERWRGVVCGDGGGAGLVAEGGWVSFGELGRRVDVVAGVLAGLGAGRGCRVGVVGGRDGGMVVAVWAVWQCGASFVAVDPGWPAARVAAVLGDAGVGVVVGCGGVVPAGVVPAVVLDEGGRLVAARGAAGGRGAAGAGPGAGDEAYVLFTSGSTGRPRGVVVGHGAVAALADGLAGVVPPAGPGAPRLRVAVNAGLAFDACVQQLVQWAAGHCLVPVPGAVRRDPGRLVRFVRELAVDVLDGTPSQVRELAAAGLLDGPGAPRLLLVGGEAVDAGLWRLLAGSGVAAVNMYGLAECGVDSTAAPVRPGTAPGIGLPLPGVRAYVLDRAGRPAGTDVTGRLWLAGPGLGHGYLADPALTADRYRPDPFAARSGERMFDTGDLARRRPDGSLDYLGRADRQIKILGQRLEPGEIEAILLTHPAVAAAAVTTRPGPPGHPHLIAYAAIPNPSHTQQHAVEAGRISQWNAIFELPKTDSIKHDPTFDIRGWISSYTGLPIPADQMREWVDGTAERVARLRPRRVLEIGCGTGLLLHRLAPYCDRYVGLDFSREALAVVRAALDAGAPTAASLALVHGEANDLTPVAGETFDTVIINSTVQYFPSAGYLEQVLITALDHLEPAGTLFVGDVRNAVLLETFHAARALLRAADARTAAQLTADVQQHAEAEEELVIRPRFFTEFARSYGRSLLVRIMPRPGRGDNEMVKYRYDAVLTATVGRAAARHARWLDWPVGFVGADPVRRACRELLSLAPADQVLGLRGVPNHRLAGDQAIQALLAAAEPDTTTARLRELAKSGRPTAVGVGWQDLVAAAREEGLHAEVSWLASRPDGSLDIALSRDQESLRALTWPAPDGSGTGALTNVPLRRSRSREVLRELRELLARYLPATIPVSLIVPLSAMPTTPSGKIDFAGLPRPWPPGSGPVGLPPDATDSQRTVHRMFGELLAEPAASLDDSFLFLGGDSLGAFELVGRLEQETGVRVSVGDVMSRGSIRELAALLDRGPGDPSGSRPDEDRFRIPARRGTKAPGQRSSVVRTAPAATGRARDDT